MIDQRKASCEATAVACGSLAPQLPPGVLFFDDLLSDPAAAREDALGGEFIDWEDPEGHVFRRVRFTEVPGFTGALEARLGKVRMLAQGYRLNFAGEMPNQAIHSDLGWGQRAAVLYLSRGPGGTAFWRHKRTGATRIDAGDAGVVREVGPDLDSVEQWDRVGLVDNVFNRCAVYDGRLFHSRWPLEAFGSTKDGGRLVAVAFFDLAGAA